MWCVLLCPVFGFQTLFDESLWWFAKIFERSRVNYHVESRRMFSNSSTTSLSYFFRFSVEKSRVTQPFHLHVSFPWHYSHLSIPHFPPLCHNTFEVVASFNWVFCFKSGNFQRLPSKTIETGNNLFEKDCCSWLRNWDDDESQIMFAISLLVDYEFDAVDRDFPSRGQPFAEHS